MRRGKIKGIIALCIMVLCLVAMYGYLTFGQKALFTKTVLVASMDIEPGTIIDPGTHFVVRQVDDDALISGYLSQSDLPALRGLCASQFIPNNAQVTSRCFDKAGVVLTSDKFVFKIPANWIYAVPSSIRRGDEILIFEIDSEIDRNISASMISNEDKLPVYDTTPPMTIINEKPVLEATVIFVKDSSNREVVDVDTRTRFDGTSQVSSIEIVSTKDDMQILEKKVAEGKKFILVYR